MANGSNRVNFEIGFSVDKSGLEQMQSLFQQIANKAKDTTKPIDDGLKRAAQTATTLDGILEKTFNTDLGSLNVTKFNQEMNKAGLTLKSVKADLAGAGNQGATAFNRLSQVILGTNMQLKQSSKMLNDMFTTFKNTVRYGISSSIFNNVANSIRKAYSYSRDLNSSLNDIRIVTDKSADSMEKFAVEANAAAKSLGASTLDYTNASLIYYQQGLSDEEAKARTETTLKAANITGQSSAAVSEQLTAVWNGYKVTAEETELYVDKLAAVAATTAADLEELSTGMSKVASAANAMGVDFDDLNAQIATIVSITRQAPESVGTALKTIYARLGDLKVDGVDEFGVKLGEVSSQLKTMGIQIMDTEGNMRDMTSVMTEVAGKQDTWTKAQREAAAVAMAGKRQYNNLIALFDNQDMYSKSLETSVNAMGTLQHQQDIFMESTEAKLNQLKDTWQELYHDLIDTDELQSGLSAITDLVSVFDNFIKTFGGGVSSIAGMGTIIANIFNKQIINAINDANNRMFIFKNNLNAAKASLEIQKNKLAELGPDATPQQAAIAENTKIQYEYAQKIYDVRAGLNQEQYNTLVGYQKELGALAEEEVLLKENAESVKNKEINETAINEILNAEQTELINILERYGEQENYLREIKDLHKEAFDLIKEELKSSQDYDVIINNIKASYRDLTENQQKEINTVLNNVKSNKDLVNAKVEIYKILNKINKEDEKNLETQRKVNIEVDKTVEARMRIAQLGERKNNLKQEADAILDMGKNAKKTARDMTVLFSGIGSVATALTSIKSLGRIISDEDMSAGDKALQIIMTLGMTIPSVISTVKNFAAAFSEVSKAAKASSEAIEVVNTVTQNKITVDKTAIDLEKEKQILDSYKSERTKNIINQTAEEITIEKTKNGLRDEEITDEQILSKLKEKGLAIDSVGSERRKQNIADVRNLVTVKTTEITVTEGQTVSETQNTVATDVNTVSKQKNASMTSFLTGVTTALTIATTLLSAVMMIGISILQSKVEAEEAALKAKREEQEAYEKQREEERKEIETQQQLLKSYNDLYEKYKEGAATKEELKNKTEELKDVLTDEQIAVTELTKDYEALNKEILENRKIKTTEKADQNQRDIEQNREKIRNNKEYFEEGKAGYRVDPNQQKKIQERAEAGGQGYLINQGETLSNGQIEFTVDLNTDFSGQDIAGLTRALISEGLVDTDMASDLGPYQINMHNAEKDNDILNIEEEYFDKQIDKYEDYNDAISDIIGRLAENKQGENYQDKLKDESNYKDLLDKAISILDTTQSGVEDQKTRALATNTLVGKYGRENETDIRNTLAGLSNEKLTSLLAFDEEIDQQKLSSNLEYYLNKAAKSFADTISKELYTASTNVLSDIQSGKITSQNAAEDDNYKKLLANLDKVKEAYPEIAEEANIVEKTQLIGTQEYIEALEKVQDKLYKLSINKAAEDLAKKIDNAVDQLNHVKIGDSESVQKFKETLDEIFNAQYEIDVQIHGEADQEFTNLSNAFDNLDTMAAKIGENFIVAADDIRELNNTFPGIIEGLTYLKDGTVKLNKDVVESAMAAAEAEAKADAEATVAKLKNQADLLRAKQKTYEKLANAALILAQGETATEEEANKAKATMSEELENLKALNSQESANSQMNNAKEVADDSAVNAGITGENQKSAFKEMADASFQAATAAIQNMQAVSSGGKTATTKGDFSSVNYNGSTGQQGNATIIAATESALTGGGDQDQAEIAEKQAQMADAAGAAANDIDGMIMQIGAKSIALDKDLGSISKGKGKVKDSKSGGKDKNKDQKEQEDEFDRYQEIKKAIDAVDRAMQRLEKDQENLFGYELIASLQQENQLLEQQAANYERLYEMQQQEAAELREQLGTMGVMFDASGAITNYAAATSAALQAYAAAIEQYNAGLIDETTLGVFEKSYENFKKLLERYDQLYYTEMQDTQDKLDDIWRKQLANNLKAQETEIKIHLDTEKAKREQNDFLKDIKQDFRKVFKDLTIDVKYDEKNFKSFVNDVGTTTKAIKDVEAEIDKMMSGGQSDMFESVSQAQEKLKELQEQLIEQGKSLYELYKQVWESYLEGMDQVKDQFDELIKRYEHFNNLLEFHRNLIELLYGDKAYDMMNHYYEAQEKNTLAQIDSMKQQVDYQNTEFEKSYQTALKAGSKVDLNDFTTQTEDMKKAYENMIESQESLNDLIVDAVELLQNKYLNSINQIIDAMNQQIWGTSFDEMKKDQEQTQKLADLFLDDVQKAYKVQSLANKIDQSISDTSNLKAQQKLQALREKDIEYLRNKKNLTQEDVELAEMRYQIALKEIALEDAQNNKTSMKLTRNEQGNQSYQYVADEDDVANKQQDLLNSMGDYYEKAVSYRDKTLETQMDVQEMMNEELAEAAEKYKEDQEALAEAVAAIHAKYAPITTALLENEEIARREAISATGAIFSKVCQEDYDNYSQLTTEQKSLVEEVAKTGIDSFGELRDFLMKGEDGVYPALQKAAEESFTNTNESAKSTAAQMAGYQVKNQDSYMNIILSGIDKIIKADEKYKIDLDKLQEVAGIDFSKIGEYINGVIGKIDSMDGATEQMANNASQYLDELRRVLNAVADDQNSVIGQIQAAQNELQNYLAMMGAVRQAQTGPQGSGTRTGSAPDKTGSGNGGSEGSPSASKKGGHFDHTEISPTANGQQYERDIQIDSDGNQYIKEIRGPLGSKNQTWDPDANNNSSNSSNSSKYSGQDLRDRSGFATGGYTGEQDNSGRLAVLHQKELVLNADDTKNFLDGITMIRDMSSLNGSISNAIVSTIGGMALSLGNVKAGIGPSMTSSSTTTDNNIFNITAEFPNANDVNDIREAILSLPNYVSQYMGRNIK